MPLASGGRSDPYGPIGARFDGGAANALRQKAGPKDTAAAVVRPDWINRRRVSMRHVYRAVYQRAKERSSGVTGCVGSPPPASRRHSGDGATTATGAPGAPPGRLR